MKILNKIIKQCHVLLNRYTMLLQDGTPYVTEKGVEEALLLFVKLSLPSDEEVETKKKISKQQYERAKRIVSEYEAQFFLPVNGSLLPLDVHKKARELSAGEFIDWWFAKKQ